MKQSYTATLIAGLAALLVGCAAGSQSAGPGSPTLTPYVLVITATPPGNDPLPPGPTDPPAPVDPAAAASPPPSALPTDAPTPAPTLTPPPTPIPGPNLLDNPGFEEDARAIDGDSGIMVAAEWKPFYCAQPQTGACYASRAGGQQGNPETLRMVRPGFGLTREPGRVYAGGAAQAWSCGSAVCRGGVYQTFRTTPGQVCEAGVRVQSWSSGDDSGRSQLVTDDDRANVTWYLRVDPGGGSDPWAGSVRVSRPFTYADGIYDAYAPLHMTFIAGGEKATLFIENTRLWPLKHNASYVDEAYVRCADAPALPDPRDRVQVGEFTIIDRDFDWPDDELGDWVRVGQEWWAYYGSRTREGATAIFRAVSADGITWQHFDDQPVLQVGPPGSWDDEMVRQPSVIYDAATGIFHLWYNGRRQGSDLYGFGFGYATSTDGLKFHKQGGGPVITPGPAGSWYEERIDGAEVVRIGDRYRLYHSGSQLQPDLIRQIGCHFSLDGIHWEGCEVNPVLSPRPDLQPFEGLELENPRILEHNGVYLMAYTGFLGPQGNRWGLGLAASLDGLYWRRLAGPLIPLERGVSTSDPVLFYDEARGELRLYFHQTEGPARLAVAPITFLP